MKHLDLVFEKTHDSYRGTGRLYWLEVGCPGKRCPVCIGSEAFKDPLRALELNLRMLHAARRS